MKKLLFTLVALLTMTGAWAATTTLTAQSFGIGATANNTAYSEVTSTDVTPAFKATMANVGKFMQIRWKSGSEAGIFNT